MHPSLIPLEEQRDGMSSSSKAYLKPLILGTRGSDLALAQSRIVRAAMEKAHPGLSIQLKTITTTGDAQTAMPLHEPTAEGAGLFTKQLEEALLRGEIDLAVHSLKDLPVQTPAGLTLAAILPRAPVDDLLVSRHPGGLAGLPPGSTVGSSSPRRALLLKARRPDLNLIPIRGNVPTRLAKVAAGASFDATILAAAGLNRLGHELSLGILEIEGLTLWLESLEWMLPAPGQGAIAVECRAGDAAEALLSVLNHGPTSRCVEAERLVLKHLGGGCHLALGALAIESPEGITLNAVFIPHPDTDSAPLTASAIAPSPAQVAKMVADRLLSS
jgi:hydroxymethylbilane synthase